MAQSKAGKGKHVQGNAGEVHQHQSEEDAERDADGHHQGGQNVF